MKKGLLLSGVIGFLAFGLASCSGDEPLGYQDEKVEKSETRYLSVALCNPTSYVSRAGEFDTGVGLENTIDHLYFVFYDGSYAPVGTPVSLDADDLTEANGWNTGGPLADTDVNNVAKFWQSTIPVALTQGENKPVYVMCYVNPIDQTGLANMTLQEVDAAKREAVRNGDGYFAMSNSVFYGPNPITGQSMVRMMATPIVGDLLAQTPEEAVEKAPVNIYVERYAAKIGLTMAPKAVENGYPVINSATGNETTILFTPTYWRPNAVDETTYITKGFSTTAAGGSSTAAATYAQMNSAFSNTGMEGDGLTGWNDQKNYRSYWSCTPSYYADRYPRCSDDVDETDDPYEVKYFTYNEIKTGEGGNPIAWNNGFSTNPGTGDGYFYSRETTASIEKLRGVDAAGQPIPNFNNKAVPASIVIVGQYQIAGATGNPTTFYLYGKKNNKDVYYANEAAVKAALMSNQNVIFTTDQGTGKPANIQADLFTVEHPSKEVRSITVTTGTGDEAQTTTTQEVVPGRLVTLQINKDKIGTTPLYFNDGNRFVQITTENVNAANRLLWKSASTAQMFYTGLAFFAIPIRHLGWNDAVDLIEGAGDNGRPTAINWSALRRGDLGLVRNHTYSYTVTEVNGLGVGLSGTDQPIVPPMDPDDYYVSVKLNILSWRVVPTHEVTL